MDIKNFKSFFVVIDSDGRYQGRYREVYQSKDLDEAKKFKSIENALKFLEEEQLTGSFQIKQFYTSNKDITDYLS